MSTCRICHKADYESKTRGTMVRVGRRHSVHVSCKFESLKNREARVAWVESQPWYTWRILSPLDFEGGLEGTFEFIEDVLKAKYPELDLPYNQIRTEQAR